jgi:hypothetical protein
VLKPIILGAAMALAVPALAQTTGSTNPDMNKPGMGNTSASQTGTMGQAGSTGQTGTTDSGWGTTTGTSGTGTSGTGATGSSAGASGTGSWNSGSSAYTGRGGPMEGAKSYPTCSRTVTDNCMQRGGGRSHSRARRGR